MKKEDVKVGGTYIARVNGKLRSVRIISTDSYGGWAALDLLSGYKIRIKDAARLRPLVKVRCDACGEVGYAFRAGCKCDICGGVQEKEN